MSFQVTEAFVEQFRDGITVRAAQRESRLRSKVEVEENIRGVSASRDFVGARRPARRTSRHGDTVLRDTPHDRRWIDLATYDDADLIDDPDKVKMLTDPTNAYSQAMAQGFGREMDIIAVEGMIGTTRTGVGGAGTPSTAPTSMITNTLARDVGPPSGEMLLSDLLTMKGLFDSREQPPERYWAVTNEQIQDLLNLAQVQSSDTNTVRALAEGNINSYMGFEWVRVEVPIIQLDAAAADQITVAWVRQAVCLGFGYDVRASIDRRPDKNNSTQIFYSMDCGACRLDDLGVVGAEFRAR